jgi:hypothetical protein
VTRPQDIDPDVCIVHSVSAQGVQKTITPLTTPVLTESESQHQLLNSFAANAVEQFINNMRLLHSVVSLIAPAVIPIVPRQRHVAIVASSALISSAVSAALFSSAVFDFSLDTQRLAIATITAAVWATVQSMLTYCFSQ